MAIQIEGIPSVDSTLTVPTYLLTNEGAPSPSQPIGVQISRSLTNVRLLTARTDGATTGVMSEAAIIACVDIISLHHLL